MIKYESEAYKNYFEAHKKLNNYIKISTAAMDFLYKSEESSTKLSLLINQLIIDADQHWTSKMIDNPQKELLNIKNDLSKTGIFWVYSSFDVFFKTIEGIASTFVKKAINDEEEKSIKIIKLYDRMEWGKENINDLIPILTFFEQLRHVIAHNMGKPNDKLRQLLDSNDFKQAIFEWKTKIPGKSISAPPTITKDDIELHPHHAIFYSDTCLRIAKDMNLKVYETLGLNHFIEKTIKKHLIDPPSLSLPECQNYVKYIIYHLKEDFNIYVKSYKDIKTYYKDNPDGKKHNAKYASLKTNKKVKR